MSQYKFTKIFPNNEDATLSSLDELIMQCERFLGGLHRSDLSEWFFRETV